ncbi:MAG: hypothetical protein ACP5KN_03270 [Armatimonadota bacterium]
MAVSEGGSGAPSWLCRHWRWALIAAVAVLLAISCRDMHLNPDSIHYIDIARTMLREHTVASWHLTLNAERVPMTNLYWPPLYPALLAVPMAAGASAHTAAWLIAVVSYTVALAALIWWLRPAEWALAVGAAFIYLSFASGMPFRALSEGPYVALMLGALLCLATAVGAGDRRAALAVGVLCGALAGAAMLSRHAGAATVGTVLLVAAIAPRTGRRRRGELLLAVLLGVVLVLGPWLARQAMVNGDLLGPQRPPSRRPVGMLIGGLGESIYRDFGAVLVAMLLGALGLRRAQESAKAPVPGFVWTLLIAGAVAGVAHIAVTMASQIIYQIDVPPSSRFFFPAYVAVLLAAAALLAMCAPPADVLRRRWALVAVAAAPIVLAPLVAGMAATDVTPRYTLLDAWIEQNTAPDDLIIAHRAWPIRLHTGRPVLEDGQVADPPVTDGRLVARFLQRFGHDFGDAHLVLLGEWRPVVADYQRAGLQLELVAKLRTRRHDYDRPEVYNASIFRVRYGPRQGTAAREASGATPRHFNGKTL